MDLSILLVLLASVDNQIMSLTTGYIQHSNANVHLSVTPFDGAVASVKYREKEK